MKVSVVLCTYSEDMYEHFREAAESVLEQTYEDVELVVVVDGNDELFEQVRDEYGDRENIVLHCNDENVGLLESRNTGAELATGDVVAFIDDDAVADEEWVEELVESYEEHDALAAGGKMTPEWVAGEPDFLPEEFYWLVGVTHRGFADGPGWVRNTFGSNISFRGDVFEKLGGFDVEIGGRKGDSNIQGGETELCARMRGLYNNRGVWYAPEARVAHKVFDYRTDFFWLMDRAFWQGYSKRGMETLINTSNREEEGFLRDLIFEYLPERARNGVIGPSPTEILHFVMIIVLTSATGLGYIYGLFKWD